MMMLIKIDDREDNVLIKELGEMEIVCYPERLEVGDYVWENVCIERKTIDDFCLSMMDGRLKSQVERMKKKFKYNYILVSGRIRDRKSDMNENSIVGMVVSLIVKYDIKVVMLDDDKQLSFALKRILERHNKVKEELLEDLKGGKTK